MKKISLMLLGAMMMTTAHAQQGLGGLVLDSTYTATGEGIRTEKTINEYDGGKRLKATYSYSYADANGRPVTPPVLTDKNEAEYNSKGQITQMNTYSYADGNYTLTASIEMSNYDDATGVARLTVMKSVSDENPSAGLQPMMKMEVTDISSHGVVDQTIYMWDEGEWMEFGTVHNDYNADGTKAKETESMYDGMMTTVTTYQYDSNKNVTRQETSTVMMGQDFGTVVTTFDNEYYADGNLKKVTQTDDERGTSSLCYFWGDGKAKGGDLTAIISHSSILIPHSSFPYDLQGRTVSNPSKGIFIVNGRKVIMK